MCEWYLRSRVYINVHVLMLYLFILSCYHWLFYERFITFINSFGCTVIRSTYTRTYLINFVSAPSPLHFCSEFAVRYIRFRIRIQSLSAPLRIRRNNMVQDMVEGKSDPI
jgi:hypothetical protein